MQRVFGGAVRERLQHLELDLGRVVQKPPEARLVHDEHADRGRRRHGRVSRHGSRRAPSRRRRSRRPASSARALWLGRRRSRRRGGRTRGPAAPPRSASRPPAGSARPRASRSRPTPSSCSRRTAAPAGAIRASRPSASARSDPNFRCRSGKRMTWCEFGGFGSQLGIQGRKHNMRKRLTLLTAVVVASLIAAVAAWAGNPNFSRFKDPVLVYGDSASSAARLQATTSTLEPQRSPRLRRRHRRRRHSRRRNDAPDRAV